MALLKAAGGSGGGLAGAAGADADAGAAAEAGVDADAEAGADADAGTDALGQVGIALGAIGAAEHATGARTRATSTIRRRERMGGDYTADAPSEPRRAVEAADAGDTLPAHEGLIPRGDADLVAHLLRRA